VEIYYTQTNVGGDILY